MESTLYDNIFRYLSDNTLPSIIIEKKSRYAIKNFKSMASDYMVKEGLLYKVCFQSPLLSGTYYLINNLLLIIRVLLCRHLAIFLLLLWENFTGTSLWIS